MSGFIKKRGFLVVRSLLLLTILFAVGAFVVTAMKKAEATPLMVTASVDDPCGGSCPNSVNWTSPTNNQTSTMTFVDVEYDGGNTTVCYDITKSNNSTVSHFLLTICTGLQTELIGLTRNGEPMDVPGYGEDGSTGFSGFKIETASGRYCFTFAGTWALGCTQAVLKDGDANSGLRCITGLVCEGSPPQDCSIICPSDIQECLNNVNGNTIDPGQATLDGTGCEGYTITGTRSDGLDLTAPYPAGLTVISWTATGVDSSGNALPLLTCSQLITVTTAEICVNKFYDANVNGLDDDGQVVGGYKMVLSGTDSAGNAVGPTEQFTAANGTVCFEGLPLGNYTVTEVHPGSNWISTTGESCTTDVTECVTYNCSFGNVCLGAGGGNTLGFWSNKNGQAQMNDGGTLQPELDLLSSLNLVNADGTAFDPGNYSSFRNWLLNATAVNMAYMLSAQLAAMTLNVEAGFVAANSLVYVPGCGNTGVGNNFMTIADLTGAANTALGADGFTPADDPNRALQECLKNGLDNANNDLNFVQGAPCPFTSPY